MRSIATDYGTLDLEQCLEMLENGSWFISFVGKFVKLLRDWGWSDGNWYWL